MKCIFKTLNKYGVVVLLLIVAGSHFMCGEAADDAEQKEKNISESENKIETEKDKLLHKYEVLEDEYEATIQKVDKVINDDNLNLNILRANLQQLLESVVSEKEHISNNNIDSIKTSSLEKLDNLSQLLEMSQEVLEERLIEMQEKDSKLTIDNRKLYNNLQKLINLYEDEKLRYNNINDHLAQINEKIDALKTENTRSSIREIKKLERAKTEPERELMESNKLLNVQKSQIQELSDIIQKITLDCYYYYHFANNSSKSKVFLTKKGISEPYVQYFLRKKPDIYVEFKIPSDIYDAGVKKMELKMYNSLNVEIYNVIKRVNSDKFKIIIPNKNYLPGKYSIAVFVDGENLLLDDKYLLKIAE